MMIGLKASKTEGRQCNIREIESVSATSKCITKQQHLPSKIKKLLNSSKQSLQNQESFLIVREVNFCKKTWVKMSDLMCFGGLKHKFCKLVSDQHH